MAEARRGEEEGERREPRDVRNRSQTTEHPERTKPDHLHSSQGALSSIRAAIKRTRTNSQCDHTRDRRRPEITIVSAEPLAQNNWFSGTSVVFPPLPPVSQPPPSYDQVIHEKNQEEHLVKPTAARRTTCTSTNATQTDPEREDTSPSAPKAAAKRPAGKKPQKPPRPHLPKPVDREPVAEHTRCVTVHWDIPINHPSAPAAEATHPSSTDSEHSRRPVPVPLPRTKPRKQANSEGVQTLVKFSENCDDIPFDPEDEVSPNKYLKELLEVLSPDYECEENGHIVDQSDEALLGEDAGGEMSTNHSQRNILARIQSFERQTSTEGGNVVEPAKPEPRSRKAATAPPVAAKPSVAMKPLFNHSIDKVNQNVSSTNIYQTPTPAPRPQLPKQPAGFSIKEELETIHSKMAINPNRSRPAVLTRASRIYEEESSVTVPPSPPPKPSKEPLKPNLNINNHNSASMYSENQYVKSPSNPTPVKPQRNVDSDGGFVPRPVVARRPTTIRVPSKTDSLSENIQDSPPPLPSQKPVGHLTASVNHNQSPTPTLPSQESFQPVPEPSLPPRKLNRSITLPPRPPPAKTGPARPPPPSLQGAGRSQTVSWETSPKPQTHKPQRKGPVLPPRPNPGHRLYNKYTLQLSHGIADVDYNGSNTGELSFQKNEVLVLLDEVDRNTFECQVGDTTGRVHKSRMKVITPLESISHTSPPQGAGPTGYGLKVQAIHDFNPAGPGELALRAGDVVTMVEQVDSDWYTGTCRGSSGFFPVDYVKVLSNSPKPLPVQKAKPASSTVSGPRCVARFDFEGESSDELSFLEGDMIQLKALAGEEWAEGQIGDSTGFFPLNFVEVIEDLPPATSQQRRQSTRIPLPGMAASPSTHPEVAKPAQASQSGVEWVVALYDYDGSSEGDLAFNEGEQIMITQHIDAEWSSGRLNGREGIFPRAFVESSTGQQSSNKQPNSTAAAGGRGRALFEFVADCEEELSLKAGDIITNLESVNEEWFLGDLRGKRAMVPKNYVEVLG